MSLEQWLLTGFIILNILGIGAIYLIEADAQVKEQLKRESRKEILSGMNWSHCKKLE